MHETTKRKRSLVDYYELKSEEVEDFSKQLFEITNGHPRTLLAAFRDSSKKSSLLSYDTSSSINWVSIRKHAIQYKSEIRELLENYPGGTFDLSKCKAQGENKEKMVSYDIIANNAFISWSGKLEEANLFAPPTVIDFLLRSVYPLRDYLTKILTLQVSVDYPLVFEWMFIKRFIELFSGGEWTPKTLLPSFFDTPLFGNAVFNLKGEIISSPKITDRGSVAAQLDSKTAHPSMWSTLIAQLIYDDSICLKPLPKSASSDALFFANMDNAKKLTLGLAVKNYKTTKFSLSNLD